MKVDVTNLELWEVNHLMVNCYLNWAFEREGDRVFIKTEDDWDKEVML